MDIDKDKILGLTEPVILYGKEEKKAKTIARVDSGATISSIDVAMASKLNLGPILKTKIVKSANGQSRRPTIESVIEIKGKKIKSLFTIADRRNMKFPILIGQNTLKEGKFLINPSKGIKTK